MGAIQVGPRLQAHPRTPTAEERVNVTDAMEVVLAAVPKPFPQGQALDQSADQAVWEMKHGGQSIESVAKSWAFGGPATFVDLAAHLHSVVGNTWTLPRPRTDYEQVALTVFDHSIRVWNARWEERQFTTLLRARSKSPSLEQVARREEAIRIIVEDGEKLTEILGRRIASTPERFDAFKNAVRDVVSAILGPSITQVPQNTPDGINRSHDADADHSSPLHSHQKPRWDATRRELTYREHSKRFDRHPAPKVTLALEAFEELNWPESIDSPEAAGKMTNDLTKSLNRSITFLKFRGTGDGKRISWEVRRSSP